MRRRGVLSGSVAAAVCAIVALVAAPPAHASCAWPPSPSRYAFTGVVIHTEEEGRVATVITDTGRQVTVLGTDAVGRFSDSFTSVDRRYAVGGRYEFHPIDRGPPYRDNACTATKRLAGPAVQPVEQQEDLLPGWLPVDEQTGTAGYALLFAPVLLGALVVVAAARWGMALSAIDRWRGVRRAPRT